MKATSPGFAVPVFAAFLFASLVQAQVVAGDEHALSVTGVGSVTFEPDFGTLRMNVTGTAGSVADAKDTTDGIAGAFVAAVEELGVESRDIRSDPLTARPGRDRDGRQFINYSRDTTLILRDLSLFEDVEAAAIEAGITNIGGIEYGYSEIEQLQDEALQLAFDDARNQAEQAARALDLSLGRVLSASIDQRPQPFPSQPMMMRAAEAAANIRTGVQQVTRTVRISYRLLE